jgi:hypothetical protein
MNKNLLLTFLLSLVLLIPVYSQEKDTTYTDTTKTDIEEGWDNQDNNPEAEGGNKWDDIGSHMFDFKIKGVPTISFNYGFSKMNLKSINQNFTKPGMLELKVGYTTEKSYNGSDNVLKYKFNYLHISNFTPDLAGNKITTDLNTNTWRFGFGWASGYGYDFGGGFSIIPFHSGSIDWTKMDMHSTPATTADLNTTNLFNKDIRFGNSFQGGIQLKFMNSVAIEASYERSVVYPRHLFWKWGMGMVIEGAGQGLVDLFIDKVLDSSPAAAPIVNFLLKNALSYGIYELRQDKMNWPFETVAPLTFDQFKVGITIVL